MHLAENMPRQLLCRLGVCQHGPVGAEDLGPLNGIGPKCTQLRIVAHLAELNERGSVHANLQNMLGQAVASKQAGANLLNAAEGGTAAQLIADLRRKLASATSNH
jgi:hypothetical protein